MKVLLFITVVIAIAALFVIGQPLVEWHDEIANLSHQISNILEDGEDEYDNLMALPGWATTGSDFVQASLRANMRQEKVYKLNKKIAKLFENKPFGLALTEGEQADYASVKQSIAKHEGTENASAEPSDTATSVTVTNTPSSSPPVAKKSVPQYVTLTEQIQLPIIFQGKPSGHAKLAPGTRLQLVSVSDDSVIIRYGASTATIPLASTDFRASKK